MGWLYWDSAIMGGTTVVPWLMPWVSQNARVPQCFLAKLVDLPNSLPTVCGRYIEVVTK